MYKSYETTKYSADKIALFGFLVFALLIAGLIVRIKKAVVYSEPIKLNHSGLSVSVPAGNGWQSEMQWKFHENTFLLYSIFNADLSSPTVFVFCTYHLSIPAADKNELFNQKAESVGGTVLKTGQIQNGTLNFDWAQIKTNPEDSKITLKKHLQKDTSAPPKTKTKQIALDNLFYATAQLPDNRMLDIEVSQSNNYDLAEKLFGQIIKRLVFEDNKLLSAGNDVVSKIKETGLSRFLENQNKQNFFVIKNATKRPIGFTMDVLDDSPQKAPLNIQAADFLYIRTRFEQTTTLQSDNNFNNFQWNSEGQGVTGTSGYEIIFNNGKMTVTALTASLQETEYQLNPASMPAVFFDFLLIQMLETGYEKILVDIIEPEGIIIPVLISRIKTQNDPQQNTYSYLLKIDLLNDPRSTQLIYLNNQMQILKKRLKRENWTFELTNAENILRNFPERANDILQQNPIQNQFIN